MTMRNTNSTDPKGAESLTRGGRGFTVEPSPFNAVKLELAVAVSLLVLAWLAMVAGDVSDLWQVGILAGLGGVAAVWIGMRTRAVLNRHTQGGANAPQVAARPGAQASRLRSKAQQPPSQP